MSFNDEPHYNHNQIMHILTGQQEEVRPKSGKKLFLLITLTQLIQLQLKPHKTT